MAEQPVKMTDVYNAGENSFGLRDGSRLEPGQGKAVPADEAQTLFKSYPGRIVDPKTFMPSARATSGNEAALQAQIQTLQADKSNLAAEVERLQKELEAISAALQVGKEGDTKGAQEGSPVLPETPTDA